MTNVQFIPHQHSSLTTNILSRNFPAAFFIIITFVDSPIYVRFLHSLSNVPSLYRIKLKNLTNITLPCHTRSNADMQLLFTIRHFYCGLRSTIFPSAAVFPIQFTSRCYLAHYIAFSYSSPATWNSIPTSIKNC